MESQGTDLECLLSYKEIDLVLIQDCIKIITNHKFCFRKSEEVVVFSDDFETIQYKTFIDNYTKYNKNNTAIINLEGELSDVFTKLSISINFNNKVITISIPEKALWAFKPDLLAPDFKRLIYFGEICKDICTTNPPKYAFIGTEFFLPEDFTVSKLKSNSKISPYDESVFSESELKDLFNSYINNENGNYE